MIYDFDHAPDRRPTDSVKWNAYDADVLPLWVADMDFLSPEPVLQALHQRVSHGVFGYPILQNRSGEGGELRQVLVQRMQRLYGWKIQPDDLLFLPGVITGLNQACQMAVVPGSAVLIQTPVYPPFLRMASNAGTVQQEMELTRTTAGGYEIDFETFEAAITPHTRLFTLCNPHNPVGRVFRRDELEQIAEICFRHDLLICSDEIHCDLLFNGCQHIPIASLDPQVASRTITLMAPSKTYNIAGLHCSFAIITNPELRAQFLHAGRELTPGVNLLGQVAALAAYRDGQEWLDQLLPYLEVNRDFLHHFVTHQMPQLKMVKPEGTYLAWLDCRQAGIEGSPYEFFLRQARLGLNEGAAFGRGGEGFVRLNFACPRSVLAEALFRMKAALDTL